MSRETLEWLNTNTLIGYTDKRRRAWHYRAGADNHYPGAVPVEDVKRRLFSWSAVESPVYFEHDYNMIQDQTRKAIVRSDNAHLMGIFKDGYTPHQYDEWLLRNVATILDADLGIGSAGLLRQGAVAWVSVEVPDTITTPEGVAFRPHLLACTSFDGSLATTYKRVVTNVVCDNTMGLALGEHGQAFKVKHSAKSLTKIADARHALAVVHTISDQFAATVAELCAVKVDHAAWQRIVDRLTPPAAPDATPRAQTIADTKRYTLRKLWLTDERVAPWQGTAYGAWQAYNTYTHHEGVVRGMSRPERNMLNAVKGDTDTADRDTVAAILATV